MRGLAKAFVVGTLTRDPEQIANGGGCQLGVAVNQWIKKGGEGQEYASFFDVVVWGKTADACVAYTHKGSKVAVVGELRQERWEAKDGGGKRSAVRITAERVEFLDGRENGGGSSSGEGFEPKAKDEIPF